jgi:hypothetical protein
LVLQLLLHVSGHRIAFHDPADEYVLTADDYSTWGIHFSESGYVKMATAWLKAIHSTPKGWWSAWSA